MGCRNMALHQGDKQDVLQRLTKVETQLDSILALRDCAYEALQSTKAAHKRLDQIGERQYWLWRTTIAAFISAAVGMLWTGL
jgi:hypothetical protein